MSEDYALSFRKTVIPEPTVGKNWVDALRTVFENPVHGWPNNPRRRWYLDPDHNTIAMQNAGYLLLKATPQDWTSVGGPPSDPLTNPNEQQILVIGSTTVNNIAFVYAPKGGINSSNYNNSWTIGLTNGINTTGIRNITGTAANFSSVGNQILITEFRERKTSYNSYPASALTIFISGNSVNGLGPFQRFGMHAGRIINVDNKNDIIRGITGDGMMIGRPNPGTAGAEIPGEDAWLRYDPRESVSNLSVAQVGLQDWASISSRTRSYHSHGSINTMPSIYNVYLVNPPWQPGNSYMNSNLTPKLSSIRLHGYAYNPYLTTPSFGEIGNLKYFKYYFYNLDNYVILRSKNIPADPIERQAWLGFSDRNNQIYHISMLFGNQIFDL